MVVTVETARRLLRYPSVEQRFRGQPYDGVIYEVNCLCVIPEQDGLDRVYIYFDENWEIVECVAFAQWHGHFDGSTDEELNTRKAFQMARALAHRRRCVIEEYVANGRCRGSAAPRKNTMHEKTPGLPSASQPNELIKKSSATTSGEAVPPPAAPLDAGATLARSESVEKCIAGQSVPGYQILGELGRGGMGVVYKASDVFGRFEGHIGS